MFYNKNNVRLTKREFEVLGLLRNGLSHKAAAQVLGLSKRTVDSYMQTAYRRNGINSLMQLINKLEDKSNEK